MIALLLLAILMNPSTAFTKQPRALALTKNSPEKNVRVKLSVLLDKPPPDLSDGETFRKFRRSIYTHQDWVEHRSEDRFLRTILSFGQSGFVRQVLKEIFWIVVGIASFVVLWNCLCGEGYSDFSGMHHDPIAQGLPVLELPIEPFALTSKVLALLLVFKTNAAYRRWDEGRKAWGLIVNSGRNIARMGASWISEEVEPEKRKALLDQLSVAVWAFPRSLQRHLWGEAEDHDAYCAAVKERCPPEMAQELINARHKPNSALFELSNAINALPMTYLRRIEIDKSCVDLANAMGTCESIFRSPVPLAYTAFKEKCLAGWILGLPLGLWAPFEDTWNHVGLIPAAAIMSFFFFGIEELSMQLEEPFSILPLHNMTEGIGLSAQEFSSWHFNEPSFDSEGPSCHVESKNTKRNAPIGAMKSCANGQIPSSSHQSYSSQSKRFMLPVSKRLGETPSHGRDTQNSWEPSMVTGSNIIGLRSSSPRNNSKSLLSWDQKYVEEKGKRLEVDDVELYPFNEKTQQQISPGEYSRRLRRSFFTHEDWDTHRSDSFSKKNLSFGKLGGVRRLAREVWIVFGTALFVVLWNCFCGEGYLDFSGVHHAPISHSLPVLELPTEPFLLSSQALALLLVFKTNAAYRRWCEARTAWGLIDSHGRNIVRMGASWMNDEGESDSAKRRAALDRLAVTVWSFPRALQRHLWGEIEDHEGFCAALKERCPPKMAQGLIMARHKPCRALFELSNAINDLPMPYLRKLEIDKSCVELTNAMGTCDRIFSSPVPLLYTRHKEKCLAGYLSLLPLGLWSPFADTWNHVGLIPAAAIMSFFFLGIEELSIQLEEPFSILPLHNITEEIVLSTKEFTQWHFD